MPSEFLENFNQHEVPSADVGATATEGGCVEGEEELDALRKPIDSFFGRMKEMWSGVHQTGRESARAPRAAGALLCGALASGCASVPGGASDRDVEKVLGGVVTEEVREKRGDDLGNVLRAAGTIGGVVGGVALQGPGAVALEPLRIAREYHLAQATVRSIESFNAARATGGGTFTVEKFDGDEVYTLAPYDGPVTDFAQLELKHETWMAEHDAWSKLQETYDWEHPAEPPAAVDIKSLGLNVDACIEDTGVLNGPFNTHAHSGLNVLAQGKFMSFLDKEGEAAYQELTRVLSAGCFKSGDRLFDVTLVKKKPVPDYLEQFGQ